MTYHSHHTETAPSKPRSLSDALASYRETLETLKDEKISFEHVFSHFKDRSTAFFIFLLALPSALPVPAVGYGTIFGIPLFFLSTQQAIGKDPIWLPRFVWKFSVKRTKLIRIIDKVEPELFQIEKLSKPRFQRFTTVFAKRIFALFGILMALCICIPLPLTNTVPSFGLALLNFGIIMRDGLACIIGAIIGLLWSLMIFGVLFFIGIEGLDLVKELIKGLF